MPRFSILIPTYNREKTISRAIDSALAQTIDDYEVVVVDDGSNDDTRAVVEEYNDEVRLIGHDYNKGQNAARNTGLKAAKGKYISYLDSDDEFLPPHLERVNELLKILPDKYGGVITACEDFADGTSTIKEVYEGEVSQEDLAKDLYKHIAGLTTLTFRTDLLNDIGYHDENVTTSTDIDFYFQILESYYLFGLNEVLCRRYKQSDSVSKDLNKLEEGDGILVEKHGHKLTNFNRSKLRYHRAIAFAELGEMKKARKWFGMCVWDYPYRRKYAYHMLLTFFGRRTFHKYSLYGRDLD